MKDTTKSKKKGAPRSAGKRKARYAHQRSVTVPRNAIHRLVRHLNRTRRGSARALAALTDGTQYLHLRDMCAIRALAVRSAAYPEWRRLAEHRVA